MMYKCWKVPINDKLCVLVKMKVGRSVAHLKALLINSKEVVKNKVKVINLILDQ